VHVGPVMRKCTEEIMAPVRSILFMQNKCGRMINFWQDIGFIFRRLGDCRTGKQSTYKFQQK
jgi:hypothetical protein